MKLIISLFISLSTFALSPGELAPKFALSGSPVALNFEKLKGKYVVLEWYNEGCPYVRKHYDSKNMQSLQRKYKDKVAWLVINSSAQGKQGHLEDSEHAGIVYKKEGMQAQSLLLDSDGNVGRLYGAKTTPHMYIINPAGKVVYMGAIDSIRSSDPSDIKRSKNFVDSALEQALAGKKVSPSKTKAYGCSVKY